MPYMGFVIPVYDTEPRVLEETVKDLRSRPPLPICTVNDGPTRGDAVELLRRLESMGVSARCTRGFPERPW